MTRCVRAGLVSVLLSGVLLVTGCSPSDSGRGDSGQSDSGQGGESLAGEGQRRWRPSQTDRWQVQLSGAFDDSIEADVYDLDGDATTARQVAALHRRGKAVVCYIDAGAVEHYRADAADFPADLIGNVVEGWPDERWLDIRQLDQLEPLLRKRIETCKAKGFDGVNADNMQAYTEDTGFPLTREHQLAFIRLVARLSHQAGLAYGLKNSSELLPELGDVVNFAVNEQCHEYGECDDYTEFLASGRAVVNIEYTADLDVACGAAPPGMDTILKPEDLSAPLRRCP